MKYSFCCLLFGMALVGSEYSNSNALQNININEAYNLGYSGSGITVGVIDTPVRLDHPELSGKISNYPYINKDGQSYTIDWSLNAHGTHVAGIIAAAKNGSGMQGVAYDASIYAIGYLAYMSDGTRSDPIIDFSSLFSQHSYIRIYNNSYGPTWRNIYDPTTHTDYDTIRPYALGVNPKNNPDIVFAFAAGNDGEYTPGDYGLYPRYQGAGQVPNLISVGSLNNAGISTNASGNLVLSSGGVSYYSNLAGGAELWSVFAPGSNIYSLNAVNNGYTTMSGTSMATPVVSGALALVLEAFPWLSGKQLADSILTTANNDFIAPEFILNTTTSGKTYVRWIDTTSTMTESKYRALFSTNCQSTFGTGAKCTIGKSTSDGKQYYWVYDSSGNLAGYYAYDFSNVEFQTLTREQVFGQGILDVGKAVQGIARLDANRMNAGDVVSIMELDSTATYAIETFDTKGYSGEFANDITSRDWDDKYHYDTTSSDATALKGITGGIGLSKKGEGTLILSGDNTYSGATLVDGGILNISKRSKTTSAGSVGTGGIIRGSGVVVRENGTLTGNGAIYTHVVNKGSLISSVYLGNGLSVQSIDSSGTINIIVQEGVDSSVSGALIINNSLGGGGSRASTISGNLNINYLMRGFVKNEQSYTTTSPFIDVVFGSVVNTSSASVSANSPTLSTKNVAINSDYTATFDFMRASNAYSQYATNALETNIGDILYKVSQQVGSDDLMGNLLAAIDWSASGSDVTNALSDIYYSPEIFYTNIGSSFRQQSDFNQMILTKMLSLDTRKNGEWSDWIMPFGLYGARSKGVNIGYSSWSAGALLGIDASIDNSMFGFHLGFANRDINLDTSDKSSTLGVYLGSHGKVDMKFLYLVFAHRFGFESADISRDLNISGSSHTHKNDLVNINLSTLLGLGYDFRIGHFSLGPLVFAQYSHLVRTIKDTSASDISLPLNLNRHYNASSLAAGAKFGYKVSELVAFDFYAMYRRELGEINIKENVFFSGYDANTFSYATNLFDRDYGILQASFKMFGTDFGGFLGATISAEISKSNYFISGNLELGYRF